MSLSYRVSNIILEKKTKCDRKELQMIHVSTGKSGDLEDTVLFILLPKLNGKSTRNEIPEESARNLPVHITVSKCTVDGELFLYPM